MTNATLNAEREGPRYPLNLAFVLQLERVPEANEPGLAGRIEHVTSGQSLEFTDRGALLQFIDAVLRPIAEPAESFPIAQRKLGNENDIQTEEGTE